MFRGTGTINGDAVPYKFQIWAGDNSVPDPDTFRIKIWDDGSGTDYVKYDNGMDQPISGGNIKIHSNNRRMLRSD
jgi:hypothetical protein